ncbi:tRNA threonylcarbamoyladenosine biosynthesis protein TsaB [Lutibacter oricola]|uniref:tRNA threonylcarbamoyladenosine biosynthesis protein TsaB n=1 Tax=Lutibacter oricola TaxID=762486 RepID=A0A1H2SWM9_9FLAO|nr:tRNA (adenosine(37)-N6)-threonylcarbamoyltransferase complex dimerization subunit type 1 TsaB [Lutibacter oricola]SDW35927.1 tRNA threonylcarbamoyladenosine biosynthesis protein TsaB [Lutibacter oricola]
MAFILNIETATKNCSVSVAENGKTIALKEYNDGGYSHAEKLHKFIKEVCEQSNIELSQLAAVAVSKGPGSYTGLRIGVSAAKGLCFALNLPLISIHTLEALANTIETENKVVIPLLDARRMEVYCAIFKNGKTVEKVSAKIIDENSFSEYLVESKVYFVGDGAEKCKSILKSENAIFIDDKFPSANEMSELSFYKYKKNDIEDVAYFEPFYLKDFVTTVSKK